MSKAIAYYRVSTERQGNSGLGLEAQRVAVEDLCTRKGWDLIAPPFTEVMSGRRDDRPELLKAIHRCRRTGAKLVIAKMDRVGRRAATLLKLLDESGVSFVAADDPEADWTSIALKAVIAEHEGKAIGRRTKEALAAKREQLRAEGKRLGNPNGAAALRAAGKGNVAALRGKRLEADKFAAEVAPDIARLRERGFASYAGIARALNEEGSFARRGGPWDASSVRNVLARLAPA